MNTASGDCKISKNSSSAVTVSLKHTYEAGRYTPVIEQQGDLLTIKEEFKSGNNSGQSTWTLTVPDDVDITVTSGSGDIEAGDLTVHHGSIWHRVQQSNKYGAESRRRVMYIPLITGKCKPRNANSRTPLYHNILQKKFLSRFS